MKDNFSLQAGLYAAYRPTYPDELFDFVLSFVNEKSTAWDCATGNGQTAKEIAKKFSKVFATDISQKQIEHAYRADNIFYSVQPAEKTNFDNDTFDLVTVSQALHWFDFNKFYPEVKRVLKQNSIIAAWSYDLLTVSKEIDDWIKGYLYEDILGKYWDDERRWVEEHYATIPFPFKEIQTPVFKINDHWDISSLEGYFNSWSATQKFIKESGTNPVTNFIQKIKPLWGTGKQKIVFRVYMRMGRLEK